MLKNRLLIEYRIYYYAFFIKTGAKIDTAHKKKVAFLKMQPFFNHLYSSKIEKEENIKKISVS
jgi:hypothetical protein